MSQSAFRPDQHERVRIGLDCVGMLRERYLECEIVVTGHAETRLAIDHVALHHVAPHLLEAGLHVGDHPAIALARGDLERVGHQEGEDGRQRRRGSMQTRSIFTKSAKKRRRSDPTGSRPSYASRWSGAKIVAVELFLVGAVLFGRCRLGRAGRSPSGGRRACGPRRTVMSVRLW